MYLSAHFPLFNIFCFKSFTLLLLITSDRNTINRTEEIRIYEEMCHDPQQYPQAMRERSPLELARPRGISIDVDPTPLGRGAAMKNGVWQPRLPIHWGPCLPVCSKWVYAESEHCGGGEEQVAIWCKHSPGVVTAADSLDGECFGVLEFRFGMTSADDGPTLKQNQFSCCVSAFRGGWKDE